MSHFAAANAEIERSREGAGGTAGAQAFGRLDNVLDLSADLSPGTDSVHHFGTRTSFAMRGSSIAGYAGASNARNRRVREVRHFAAASPKYP